MDSNVKSPNYGRRPGKGRKEGTDDKSKSDKKPDGKRRSEGERSSGSPKDKTPWKNDWRWYAATEQIARDVASIPFSHMTGFPFKLKFGFSGDSTVNIDAGQSTVCAINYDIGFGRARDAKDPVNIAAMQLYTYVRHVNSGSRNYEAPDIMMYILAMRDIYASFAIAKRAYGVAASYNQYNRALPRKVLQAMGFDPISLSSNLAKIRYRLNLLAAKINSFAVPVYFKAFLRDAFVASNVFMDSTASRGQFYLYRKLGYFTWSGTTSTRGTSLNYRRYSNTGDNATGIMLVDDFLGILEAQLNALYYDEDAGIISGDILKAFSDNQLFQLAEVPTTYQVVPFYDEDALAQIENSWCLLNTQNENFTLTLKSWANDTMDITQEGQNVIWQPHIIPTKGSVSPLMASFTNMVFNSHKDNPEFTDVLEWSRSITFTEGELYQDSEGTGSEYGITANCGLELIYCYTLWTGTDADNVSVGNFTNVTYFQAGATPPAPATYAIMEQFDWHPTMYIVEVANTGRPNAAHLAGDIKVPAMVTFAYEVSNMHDAAVFAALWDTDLYSKGR